MYLDVEKIRKDFPILSHKVNGHKLIYFDNAATTQKPLCVIEKISELYSSVNANVHRGIHTLSQQATYLMEDSREAVRRFINAKSTKEIVFTKGTTESVNLVASSFCRSQCKPGDEIIITAMEHHANIVPWQIQKEISGIELKVVPIDEKGEIALKDLEELISSKTRLISVTHVSNVLGTINPIKEIINLAHSYNVPVLIDAAQSVQHLPVDVQALDCDFLVFSAHKLYGPTGVGVLYGKESRLNELPPYQGGGEMIKHVSFEKTTFNELPLKFEAGTPNFIDIIAFMEAINYVEKIGLKAIARHEDKLLHYATEKLSEIEGVRIIGNAANKSSVLSFYVDGIHPYDMALLLDQLGIAIRSGNHCAQPLMTRFGIEGTARASFSFYNTEEEIDIFEKGLKKVLKMF